MATFKTRAQHVADDLRERILGGEFKGGSQLRQDALARDYDVSRIPVREALLTLESEGLVEFHAHRGAFTTELSVAAIRELAVGQLTLTTLWAVLYLIALTAVIYSVALIKMRHRLIR